MTDDPHFYSHQVSTRRRRPVIIGAAAALSLAVLLFWWSGRGSPGAEEPAKEPEAAAEGSGVLKVEEEAQERMGLETAEAEVRPLASQIHATGVVGPNEARAARLRALSSGVITGVMVRPGDRVKAGQALLTYDNIDLGEAQAEHAEAAAALERARSEAEVSKLALERANHLVTIGGIAEAEQQRRKAEYAATQAAVRTYEAQIANLSQKLSRFGAGEARPGASEGGGSRSTLRAPFSGVLLEVIAAVGETVSPERELASVVDLSTVWVQGDLYERDLASVAEGSKVRVVVHAYPEDAFEGTVTSIGASLDPASRTAKVRCEVKNEGGRLRLQMPARLEIAVGKARERLAIPPEAVQQIDGEPSVFVRTGAETFERRAVKL